MKARSDHGNYWYASKRFVKLRAAALRDQRTAACARLFDENRERATAAMPEPTQTTIGGRDALGR